MKSFVYFLCALALLPCVRPMNDQWNMEGKMSDNLMSYQEESGWQPVGELVEESEMVDDEEEKLEDASDPKMISESVCLDILMTLDTNPKNLKSSLEGLNLDQARRPRGRCFRSRDYPIYSNTGGPRPAGQRPRSFCYGPLYVIYGRNRYCCPNYYEHPIVQRRVRRIRCRCLYDS